MTFLEKIKARKSHKEWINMVKRIQTDLDKDSVGKRRIYKLVQVFNP